MRPVFARVFVFLVFCASAVPVFSWSYESYDTHEVTVDAPPREYAEVNPDAPLIEDMSRLMSEIEKLSEWNPMDAGGSTGTGNTTTTTTTTPAPSPYLPASRITLAVAVNASVTVTNTTWETSFSSEVQNLLGIPSSESRVVDFIASSSSSSYFFSFIIKSSSIPSDPLPSNLSQTLVNEYAAFLSLSSVQYVQVISTINPVVTAVFECPGGLYLANCPASTTTNPSTTAGGSSSNTIDTFWFYVIGIGVGVGLIVIGTVVYFACCRATDSRLKNEEFRGVELQYEAPFSTSGQPIVGHGGGSSSAAAVNRQQGLFEEVTLHELEAQQAEQGAVRKRDISVG